MNARCGSTVSVTCVTCAHRRMRAPIQLFDARSLHRAAILRAHGEYGDEDAERAQVEFQRVQAGEPFLYEPFHYAWCAALSSLHAADAARSGDAGVLDRLVHDEQAAFNPVTGELLVRYVLCCEGNSTGHCDSYIDRDRDG